MEDRSRRKRKGEAGRRSYDEARATHVHADAGAGLAGSPGRPKRRGSDCMTRPTCCTVQHVLQLQHNGEDETVGQLAFLGARAAVACWQQRLWRSAASLRLTEIYFTSCDGRFYGGLWSLGFIFLSEPPSEKQRVLDIFLRIRRLTQKPAFCPETRRHGAKNLCSASNTSTKRENTASSC